MYKTIVAAAAAVMMTSAANAAIITNGGNPTESLTEIQQKIDSGQYHSYPGVVRISDGGFRITPTSHNYLFKSTFKPGMALPKVHDIVALQRALKKNEVILVASNDLVLPTPSIFVELARQNGVDPVVFMEHYITATSTISSDAFGLHAKAQTQAILQAMSIPAPTINVEVLTASGVSELEAEQLAHAMTRLTLQRAQEEIASLTAEQTAAVVREANLIMNLDSVRAQLTASEAQVALYAADIHDLEVRVGELQARVNELEDLYHIAGRNLVRLQGEVDALEARNNANAVILNNAIIESRAKTREITRLQGEISTLRATVAEGTASLADLQGRYDDAMRSAIEHRDAGILKDATIRRLEGELAAINARIAGLPTTREITTSSVTNAAGVTTFTNGDHTHRYNVQTLTNNHLSEVNPAQGAYAAAWGGIHQVMTAAVFANIHAQITIAVEAAFQAGYNDGYSDGYNDGYADGFSDGVASAQ